LVSLSGRMGVVTGGGSGIGRACALSLARAGADVAVFDRDEHAGKATAVEINTRIAAAGLGGNATFVPVDVSCRKDVTEAIVTAQKKLGGTLSHAVNCAGITCDGWMSKMTDEDWDRVLNINLKGTFILTQAVSNAIMENNKRTGEVTPGSIVNISSIIGKVGNLGQANYSAAKGGVISFGKTAAKELARHNIRVNTVLPGFIDTPMAQAVPKKVLNRMLETIPMGRLGHVDEIANTCVFLCSDKSSFITGTSIEVTGGQFM